MSATSPKAKAAPVIRTIKVSPSRTRGSSRESGSEHSQGARSPQGATTDDVQIEQVVNRGLDLAETGIGLGVNIVARLGSILKDQVMDRFGASDLFNTVVSNKPQGNAQGGFQTPDEQAHGQGDPPQAPAEQAYYLINRLPLFPGGELALSFSINNDSLTEPKQIRIEVEAFHDEARQHEIGAALFHVSPSDAAIAPADFEKFVLKATLPVDIAPATYYGWIGVAAQEVYRIPVVLVITSQQGGGQ